MYRHKQIRCQVGAPKNLTYKPNVQEVAEWAAGTREQSSPWPLDWPSSRGLTRLSQPCYTEVAGQGGESYGEGRGEEGSGGEEGRTK